MSESRRIVADSASEELGRAQAGLRRAVRAAQELGVPVLAMSASLAYVDSHRTERLPQNLTQAQRDASGADTNERADHTQRGLVHTDWLRATREHGIAHAHS